MARPLKFGLDFSQWDVRIFEDDERFDKLLDAQGWTGFGVYFYICQKAYATEGYYLKWSFDNAARTARYMGGGVKADTVKQAVSLCLQIGLFDKRLFDREGVLTSRGLQKGWMNAVEKRAENGRTINPKLWLLKKKETKSFICMPENADFLPENADFLPENDTESRGEEKESREKESKLYTGKIDKIINEWNSLDIYDVPKVMKITSEMPRYKKLKKIIDEYGVESIFKAIDNVRQSDFLLGRVGDRNWKIDFDFFVRPDKFVKILEGGYKNNGKTQTQGGGISRWDALKQAMQNNERGNIIDI